MPNLGERLSELARLAHSLKPESTLRQYFIQALDEFVQASNLFAIQPGLLFRLDEPIIRGKPDARIGALAFEVKLPKPEGKGLPEAIKQVSKYIDEYRTRGVSVRGIAYDGESIALLDEQREVIFQGLANEGAAPLASWLSRELQFDSRRPEDFEEILRIHATANRRYVRA